MFVSPFVALPPAISTLPAHVKPPVVVRHAHPAPYGWQVLTVRNGDTLSDIAIAHRSTVGALVARNRIADGGDFLAVGRRLWVPRIRAAHVAPARVAARTATHVVRSGDTLGGIAAHYRVSLSMLYSLNKISRTAYIQPGQRIKVPAPAARAAAKAGNRVAVRTTTLVVRSGDTIGALAVRHGVSQASLLKANGLTSRSVLQIGQRLKVVTAAKRIASANTFAGRTYSDRIVRAAAANRAYLARHNVPSRTQMKAMIASTARRHGLDPKLVLAISWQESGWNQRQVSVANAIGAMQVIPSSGLWASDLSGRRLNLLNAQDNITAGMVILRTLTRSAHSEQEAIAGYYQGLYSVQHDGMFPDTLAYVKSILMLKGRM